VAQTPDNEAAMQGNIDLLALAVWLVKMERMRSAQIHLILPAKRPRAHVNTMKDRSIQKAMMKSAENFTRNTHSATVRGR